MVILIEFIGHPEPIPDELLKFIGLASEVSEVKAVAFRGLS